MSFLGFERPDGAVGVRNHVLVMGVVGCVEEVARRIAERVEGAISVTQHHSCLTIGNEQLIHLSLIHI